MNQTSRQAAWPQVVPAPSSFHAPSLFTYVTLRTRRVGTLSPQTGGQRAHEAQHPHGGAHLLVPGALSQSGVWGERRPTGSSSAQITRLPKTFGGIDYVPSNGK